MPHARLNQKVAIIVGASRGIGVGIANRFAAEGAKLVLTGRDESALNEVCARLRGAGYEAIYAKADIRSEADMASVADLTLDRFGRIDILCQNAGIFPQVKL